MAYWRIVCIERATVLHPTPHPHIVGVGTGDRPDWADMRWSLNDVLAAMEEGDTFYTQGATSEHIAEVERYVCSMCGRVHIRSAEDKDDDNDLENLRECVYGPDPLLDLSDHCGPVCIRLAPLALKLLTFPRITI